MTPADRHPPISELTSLAGKRAIVTGGAAGIGLAICRRLAEAGARVVIADTDSAAGAEAVAELANDGHRAGFVHCDVSQEDDVHRLTEATVAETGGIDILVNNAGIYPRVSLVEMTTADFERVIDVNLKGIFLCSREASIRMIDQGTGGCIINIGSIDSVHPSSDGMTAYDASKGGVLMLTKSMARELGDRGIRVNAIAPGGIRTRATQSHMQGPTVNARAQLRELKSFLSRMALGRMGDADEIARVALFLASEMASYLTGSLIIADGGYLVG